MAKLAVTSRTVVSIGLISLNLDTVPRIFRAIIRQWLMRQFPLCEKWSTRFVCTRSPASICAVAGKMRTAA